VGLPVEPEDLARPWRWEAVCRPWRLGDVACGEAPEGLHVAALYDARAELWLTSTRRRGVHGVSTAALGRMLTGLEVYRWRGEG
jgi:hypothetical protein